MRRTRLLTFTTLLALTLHSGGDNPLWWTTGDPPVIDQNATPNNYGPANIGQAKHMVKSALDALHSVLPLVADQIEADLVEDRPNPQDPANPLPPILQLQVPPSKTPEWIEQHKAPLLTGQLKAIAGPFYTRLEYAAHAWLAAQRLENGTESGGIFPWTDAPTDDNHHGMANLGQLKAVFSLHFTRDTDGDTLPDLREHALGTNPGLTMSFTGIPDAWLAIYYTTVTNFVPTQDDDSDGLTNFAEYRHRTNPLLTDTDGDDTPDGIEVGHGGNPNNPADGGNPPSDPLEEVEFTVGGDYTTWRMEIKATGPRDNRTLNLTSPQPGQNETQSTKLWKNNRYEITLHRTGGVEDWYCWEAAVDSKPTAETFDEAAGYYQLGGRNDQSHFFAVAGHWLVDNRQGLLTSHLHSYENDIASPLKAELIPVAIEDNIEATGVDIVSNSVAPEVAGYQDKLWIMAPSGNDPDGNPCSNAMKFKIPCNPSTEMEITYPQGEPVPATPTPDTVTLGAVGEECAWHGESTNSTETPAVVW